MTIVTIIARTPEHFEQLAGHIMADSAFGDIDFTGAAGTAKTEDHIPPDKIPPSAGAA